MRMYTTLVVIVTMVAIVTCDKASDIKKTCLAESKVPEADLAKLESKTMKATDQYKCYVKCYMQNYGSMKADNFDANAAIKNLQASPELKGRDADIIKAVNTCKDAKGSNPCDLAYNILACINDQGIQVK